MPDLSLNFNPPDLVPGPVLVGQGDYNVDEQVIIKAPSSLPGEPDIIFEQWVVSEEGSSAGFSLDSPTNRIQTFNMPDVTEFSITAYYTEDSEIIEPDEWPINFQRNVTNVDDLSDILLEDIIEEHFGVITLAHGEFTDLEINQFPQSPHLVENNQSFVEGEPVVVDIGLAQGYEFEKWGASDYYDIEGFSALYNFNQSFNFDMIADELWFQLNVKAVGPFTLTVSRNNSLAGSVIGGGEFALDSLPTESFQAKVVQVNIDVVNYGYKFVEWAGDVEFIADGYTVNDFVIEVNVMTNINLVAIFQETVE